MILSCGFFQISLPSNDSTGDDLYGKGCGAEQSVARCPLKHRRWLPLSAFPNCLGVIWSYYIPYFKLWPNSSSKMYSFPTSSIKTASWAIAAIAPLTSVPSATIRGPFASAAPSMHKMRRPLPALAEATIRCRPRFLTTDSAGDWKMGLLFTGLHQKGAKKKKVPNMSRTRNDHVHK